MKQSKFNSQFLEIEDGNLRIELKYGSKFSEEKEYLQRIEITDSDSSYLEISVFEGRNEINSGLISGINGGVWLHKETEENQGQSVQLSNGDLILSLGCNLVSIQIPTLKVNWNIVPDSAEIFEFYNLENDILLRGELQIHRIDLNGRIRWSYSGKNIWVNIDGKPEVTILENRIKLIDFNHDEYLIDFYGNSISNVSSKMINIEPEVKDIVQLFDRVFEKLKQQPLFENTEFTPEEELNCDFFLRFYSVDKPKRIKLKFEITNEALSFWLDRTSEIPEWTIQHIKENKQFIETEILNLFANPIQVDRQGNKTTIRVLDQDGREIRNYRYYNGFGLPWLHKKESETFEPYFAK